MLALIQDVTGRVHIERALRESQQLFQRITETTPDLVYLFDLRAQRIVYANREIRELLGFSSSDLMALGADALLQLLHPDDRALMDARALRLEAVDDGERLETVYRMRHTDGGYRWFHSRDVVFSRNADERPQLVLGVAQDITAHKETEARLQRQLDWTTRLRNLALAMAAALTPEQVAALILQHSLDALGAQGGAVRQLQAHTGTLDVLHLIAEDVRVMDRWQKIPLETVLPVTDALHRREIVLLDSREAVLARYPHLGETVEQLHHHAFAALPLRVDGYVIGTFSLWFDGPHVFVEEERAWLEICAHQCGQALARAVLYRTEQQARATTDDAALIRQGSEEAFALLDTVYEVAPIGWPFSIPRCALCASTRHWRRGTASLPLNISALPCASCTPMLPMCLSRSGSVCSSAGNPWGTWSCRFSAMARHATRWRATTRCALVVVTCSASAWWCSISPHACSPNKRAACWPTSARRGASRSIIGSACTR
ncbi:PAS domain-containing protein [Candidatus Gracilibacteria bacterium]|nr:PAS domain-containing protein [Candidatus Gracilibacteria bacterium]